MQNYVTKFFFVSFYFCVLWYQMDGAFQPLRSNYSLLVRSPDCKEFIRKVDPEHTLLAHQEHAAFVGLL